MALANYTDLLAALATFSIRTDQAALWPSCVALCEASLNRDLSTRLQVGVDTGTIAAGSGAVTLPADFSGVRQLRETNGQCRKFEFVTLDRMDQLKARASVSGEPQYYAIRGNSLEVYPVPTADVTVSLTYYRNIPSLIANATNWLMTGHPDAYLYGSLMHFGMMAADERLSGWQQAYQTVLAEIMASDLAQQFGDRLTPDPVLAYLP